MKVHALANRIVREHLTDDGKVTAEVVEERVLRVPHMFELKKSYVAGVILDGGINMKGGVSQAYLWEW